MDHSVEIRLFFSTYLSGVCVECVSLPSIPRGNWHCKYCEKNSKSETVGEYNVNASAPGQLEGVDHAEQLAGRCIRVVKNMEAETNGCVLCR